MIDLALDTLQRLRLYLEDGQPVAASALPPDLYTAVLAEFGSIARARRAAGLPVRRDRPRRWSRGAVIAELQRLHALGVSLRDADLKATGHARVVEAARQYCGTLTRARILARIAVERRAQRESEPWDAERVLDEIRALHTAGRSVASSKVDARLRCAGRRYFETWSAAIAAAGLDYATVRLNAPSEPTDELLAKLRALASSRPHMTADDLERHPVARMLRRRFATLEVALRAAELSGWPTRLRQPIPSPQVTLAMIAARGAAGSSLARTSVLCDERSLVRAAERHFGTWRAAVARSVKSHMA